MAERLKPRPTPARRPDPGLRCVEDRGGIGKLGAVLMALCFVVWGVALILMIAARTCGIGVVC
jgi:hypothetical protein